MPEIKGSVSALFLMHGGSMRAEGYIVRSERTSRHRSRHSRGGRSAVPCRLHRTHSRMSFDEKDIRSTKVRTRAFNECKCLPSISVRELKERRREMLSNSNETSKSAMGAHGCLVGAAHQLTITDPQGRHCGQWEEYA